MKNRNLLVRLVVMPLLVATLADMPFLAWADSGDRWSIGRGSGEYTDTLRVDENGYTIIGADSSDTLTCKGPVSLQSTLAVTGAMSIAGLTCTTLNATGAATLDSTLDVDGNMWFGAAQYRSTFTAASGTWGITGAVTMASALAVGSGGTGASSLTDGGILLGSGTGAITALGAATNGQIPIGDGTTDPVLATVTGTSNQVTVTNGAGTITLSLAPALTAPYGIAAATGAFTGAVDIAGQVTMGTAGTKSTMTTAGYLTVPGNITTALGVNAATGTFSSTLNATGALTAGSTADITGNLTIGAATYRSTFTASSGNAAIGGTLTSAGKLTVTSGGADVGGTLAVTGAETVSTTLSVTGDSYLGAATFKSTNTAATGAWYLAGPVTFGGQALLLNQTTTQMLTLTPAAAGATIYSSTNKEVCVSSGTGQGAWIQASSQTVSGVHVVATCAY